MTRSLLAVALLAIAPYGWTQGEKTHKSAGDYQVEVLTDIAYFEGKDADPVRHKLDIYLPKGLKKFPVLMFVHGGTWKSGSKDIYEPIAKVWAKNGIGAVIINYRLSPKVQHPAHIEDVAKAFAWTKKNIGKYGGDISNFFIIGHSAGGHLVGLLSSNESYLKAEQCKISDIKGTVPMSGVLRIIPALFKGAFNNDKATTSSASPIDHVSAIHPPCLLMYADKDYPTLPELSEEYAKKLKSLKCEVSVVKVSGRDHITIMASMANESDPCNQALLNFMSKHGGLKLADVKTGPLVDLEKLRKEQKKK